MSVSSSSALWYSSSSSSSSSSAMSSSTGVAASTSSPTTASPTKPSLVQQLFADPTTGSDVIAQFLMQLMIVLVVTRLCGRVLRYSKQPAVIGEIVAGIILGPSVMGNINGYLTKIFPSAQIASTFTVIANMGLIIFMFYLGLELDPKLIKKQWRSGLPIALSAIVIPFGVGCLSTIFIYPLYSSSSVDYTAFVLFFGASFSFTAFPVLASILSSTQLLTSPIGVQAMSCAAVDDVTAWCVLAIASSFGYNQNATTGLYTTCIAILFVLIMLFPVRMLIKQVYDYRRAKNDELNSTFVMFLFLVCLVSSFTAEVIGIHCFFGAFIGGLIVPKEGKICEKLIPQVEWIATEVFLPLYFTLSGLKTNIGSLSSGQDWGYTIAIIILCSASKFIPACLVCKLLTKREWKFCVTIGVLMNTRGLVELIALNIGLSMGILSTKLFTMLVIMALVTTFMTSPLLWYVWLRDVNAEEKRGAASSAAVASTPRGVVGLHQAKLAAAAANGAANGAAHGDDVNGAGFGSGAVHGDIELVANEAGVATINGSSSAAASSSSSSSSSSSASAARQTSLAAVADMSDDEIREKKHKELQAIKNANISEEVLQAAPSHAILPLHLFADEGQAHLADRELSNVIIHHEEI